MLTLCDDQFVRFRVQDCKPSSLLEGDLIGHLVLVVWGWWVR